MLLMLFVSLCLREIVFRIAPGSSAVTVQGKVGFDEGRCGQHPARTR